MTSEPPNLLAQRSVRYKDVSYISAKMNFLASDISCVILVYSAYRFLSRIALGKYKIEIFTSSSYVLFNLTID